MEALEIGALRALFKTQTIALSEAQERIAELEKALSDIRLWVGNRDHAVCQGGHRSPCDCLGIKIEEVCGLAALKGE